LTLGVFRDPVIFLCPNIRVALFPLALGGIVSDSVAVDAKRILLRYGAPINILDEVPDEDRIALAREIAKTDLPKREKLLRELLTQGGYGIEEDA
tara:strand:- start:11549 stop:11833 length:285 start_codon:yes stop_codon:yes gene_type:complete